MGLNLEPVIEDPVKKRNVAMAISIIAVIALGVSLVTHSWYRAGGDIDAGMGLLSVEVCERGSCQSFSNKELIDDYNDQVGPDKQKGPTFWIAGWATLISTIAAMIALGLAALRVGQGHYYLGAKLAPAMLALGLLFVALVCGAVFLGTNPTRGTAFQLGVGWSFAAFGVGIVGGIVGAQKLTKFRPAPVL